jgi:hypothetical protein
MTNNNYQLGTVSRISALGSRFTSLLLLLFLFLPSCTALEQFASKKPLTEEEVVKGLRQALEIGSNLASNKASTIDGFLLNPTIKIPFPTEAQRVESTLRDLGFSRLTDDFIVALNRAAEQAAKDATPIFVDAIRGMTIQDGMRILRGSENEATMFMRNATYDRLVDVFKPTVVRALDATLATKYWADITTQYNRIPLVQRVNPDLSVYATGKAIDGLFTLVAEEEAKIRRDPAARTTELLRRVFGNQ